MKLLFITLLTFLIGNGCISSNRLENLEQGVVVLEDTNQSSLCSGSIIDSEGTVLTANHCIKDLKDKYVVFIKGYKEPFIAIPRIGQRDKDLALVQIVNPPRNLTVLKLASRNPDIGETVWTLGHPLAIKWLASKGTVNGLTLFNEGGTLAEVVVVDALINPGNSGGPLVNNSGEIVGVADSMDLMIPNPMVVVKTGLGNCISIDEVNLFLAHTQILLRYN